MKDEETRCGVAKDDIMYMLSTSLRKYCDSKITSLAYNLIHIEVFRDAWLEYVDLVWIELGMPNATVPDALRLAAEKITNGNKYRNAIKCTLYLFDSDDWLSTAASMVQ